MYWTDYGNGDIRRANLDGTGQTILVGGQHQPVGIDLDMLGGQMYWTEISGGDIRRANLDGTGQTILVTGLNHPRKIALDLAGGMMYWSDDPLDGANGDIRRANLDGSGETILIQGLPGPRGMYLDVAAGKMYWDDAVLGEILRANLDGSGQETLIQGLATSSLHLNTGIALDLTNGKMYLSVGDGHDILRANLDGSGLETILTGLSSPVGIAIDVPRGKMYWADILDGKILRANLDGSQLMTLVSGLTYPTNIALALSAPAQFQITAAPTAVAGTPFDITVTALDASGNIDSTYQGTVTFTGSDAYPGLLPADYAFTSSDQGMHTFSSGVTFFTAGAQTLTARDRADSSITGSANVAVVAAPASQLLINTSGMAVSGTAFDVILTALDPYANVDTNYGGTVTWRSSDTDPAVILPPNYTFQATDSGMVTFPGGVTLITLGNQTLTATDTVSAITGTTTIMVGP